MGKTKPLRIAMGVNAYELTINIYIAAIKKIPPARSNCIYLNSIGQEASYSRGISLDTILALHLNTTMPTVNTPSNMAEKQDKKIVIAVMIAVFGIILFVALAIMFQG
jgi:hypothetical protein